MDDGDHTMAVATAALIQQPTEPSARRRRARRTRPVAVFVGTLLAWVGAPAGATTTAEQGFDRIEAALAALGGLQALDRAGGITWTGTGRDDLAAQVPGPVPGAPDYHPLTESFSYRADDGRLAFETQSAVDGVDQEWIRRVFDGNGLALTVDRRYNVAFWDDREAVPAEAAMHRNMIVHELLASVLSQRSSLTPLPDRSFFGHAAHPVSGALPGGTPVTLFIGADNALLGASYPLKLPAVGSTTMSWVYDEMVQVEGLGPYPAGHKVYLDDRLIREVRYEELRAGPDPTLMRVPDGVPVPAAPHPDRA